LGQNFFLVKAGELESKFKKQHICLEKISIVKNFPDKVVIGIKNRQPAALINSVKNRPEELQLDLSEATPSSQAALLDFSVPQVSPDTQFITDKDGVIYANDAALGNNLPSIYLVDNSIYIGRALSKAELTNTLSIIERINQLGVYPVTIKSSQSELLLDGETRMVFSLNKDIREQLASLQLILETAKINSKYINLVDLRFNKPIVIYAPKAK
jgi:hypothetical protein